MNIKINVSANVSSTRPIALYSIKTQVNMHDNNIGTLYFIIIIYYFYYILRYMPITIGPNWCNNINVPKMKKTASFTTDYSTTRALPISNFNISNQLFINYLIWI